MKYFFTSLLLLTCFIGFSQEKIYKEYSYSQIFKMIETETDSVFELNDALIVFNPEKDQRFTGVWEGNSNISFENKDSLYIDKKIVLNKVVFNPGFRFRNSDNKTIRGYIHHVVFKNDINNVFYPQIYPVISDLVQVDIAEFLKDDSDDYLLEKLPPISSFIEKKLQNPSTRLALENAIKLKILILSGQLEVIAEIKKGAKELSVLIEKELDEHKHN
jgi:hypothetical protein